MCGGLDDVEKKIYRRVRCGADGEHLNK